jgi:hypothetical protein
MNKYIVLTVMQFFSFADAYENPFSCKRGVINHNFIKKASSLKDLEFLGIVNISGQKKAMIRLHKELHTVLPGDTIGFITIKETCEKSIRIITSTQEEFILTLENEQLT